MIKFSIPVFFVYIFRLKREWDAVLWMPRLGQEAVEVGVVGSYPEKCWSSIFCILEKDEDILLLNIILLCTVSSFYSIICLCLRVKCEEGKFYCVSNGVVSGGGGGACLKGGGEYLHKHTLTQIQTHKQTQHSRS